MYVYRRVKLSYSTYIDKRATTEQVEDANYVLYYVWTMYR